MKLTEFLWKKAMHPGLRHNLLNMHGIILLTLVDCYVWPQVGSLHCYGVQSEQPVAEDHSHGNASVQLTPHQTDRVLLHWSRRQLDALTARCHRKSKHAPLPMRYAVQSGQTHVRAEDERDGLCEKFDTDRPHRL